jgi:adenosylcobyric acid synthase
LTAKLLMIQGTSSGAGKSTLVIGLCRVFSDLGYSVSPFKSQNMTSNFFQLSDSTKKMASIQAIQAFASRTEPDIRMNPILLEPVGDDRSNIFLNGTIVGQMTSERYYRSFVLKKGISTVLQSLEELRQKNDIIIIEGAGSPAEINIAEYDIANMQLAEKIRVPVILTADIERGGCFASIVGTLKLLKPEHRLLIKGIVINKFRGDENLLKPAILATEKITKKEILGVVPRIEFTLPAEDSLDEVKIRPTNQSIESLNEQVDILASRLKENLDINRISSEFLQLEQN